MFPSTWLAIFGFFAFLAPGILYDLLVSRKRAERRETAFREVGRVALVSTCCTVVAFPLTYPAVASTRRWLPPGHQLPRPQDLLLTDAHYLANHVVGASVAALVFVGISVVVAWIAYRVIHRNDAANVSHVSTWFTAFRADTPECTYPLVRVRLTSGTTWVGRVVHYSPDLEIADRELVLGPPLAAKTLDGHPRDIPFGWGRVIVCGDQIETISVRYVEDNSVDS